MMVIMEGGKVKEERTNVPEDMREAEWRGSRQGLRGG